MCSKDTLSEDLVFRAAKPMVGGRADRDDGGGPQTAKREESNNFQGRYIIRHYWSGPVRCASPRYNVWGGPPGGGREYSGPTAAKGAPRMASIWNWQPTASAGIASCSR